jgi:predicted transcriptional regulator
MRKRLTGLQLSVMRVLWERGRASVAEVQEALQGERPLAYSTLATILARMERQGVVAHDVEGRTYIYRSLVSEVQVSRSMVGRLVDELFGGSPAALVSHLLESREVDPAELERIQALIEHHDSRGAARKKPVHGRRGSKSKEEGHA